MKMIALIALISSIGLLKKEEYRLEINKQNESLNEISPVIRTLLEFPVDKSKCDSLNISLISKDIEPSGFGIQYDFILNNDQLGCLNATRLKHKDSVWVFGMANWYFINFTTSSEKLPLIFGLTVGNNINEISEVLGKPTIQNQHEIIFDYAPDWDKRLKITIEENIIKKITIE